tara:strand:- start:707 stop:949 length:243 start_codon:yes stop_codon:yes gene_type:complete
MNLEFSKFFKSKVGIKLLSIMLGLGVAGLFKMSCDSRSCIVYKGPSFKENNKVVKVNKQCFEVNEDIIDCKNSNEEKIYL